MHRKPKPPPSFAALVQAFFVEHLTQQRALSPQTIAAYRDAFMLFLGFAERDGSTTSDASSSVAVPIYERSRPC